MPERTCRVNPFDERTGDRRGAGVGSPPEVDVLAPRRPGAGWVVAASLLLVACPSVTRQGSVVTTPDTRYRIGPLPSGWQEVSLGDSDLALMTTPRDYALWVDSTCRSYEDVPLVALNRQLLVGFTDVEKQDQETAPLAGREALVSRYRVKMDGVPRELALVVVKKDGCIYDFAYVAPVQGSAAHAGEFRALWSGFETEPKP